MNRLEGGASGSRDPLHPSKSEIAPGAERPGELAEYPLLEGRLEVDEDVAAENEIERPARRGLEQALGVSGAF